MKQLILGGARSGKSQLAERLAMQSGREVVYIATATVGDAEMESRIGLHRERRPEHWGLVEEPVALAQCLQQQAGELKLLLVDCLTLWLSNLICLEQHGVLRREVDALLQTLPQLPGEVILVSNEVGMGITPMGELSRHFQDELGLLHQRLAAQSDRVVLTVAGLPHVLKPAGTVLALDP
ncbi:bifunctional adenosylcobinamide kinase/adenosylcobinamide-phosphate guanylyltransferase [Motiliproteus coralliicola]|uniref:Bifunctional adenosylcobalamin biosynthesis protein n=1 Tax=Motiliproteus coralliicola TaxID=2283196 RepID=A0A369WPU9_9GAMM|nr:bifunctional adenosylcobinamide kinase/adenosylcobinamide-phosphate guanylyltransferase [Motiliproteus coralliicola]RDE22644.1 bifunctional adenosylcobinamide kinase/adenosylcobinamide-phosphate guanylyltransferase [Motiliproteus coralliicola]